MTLPPELTACSLTDWAVAVAVLVTELGAVASLG